MSNDNNNGDNDNNNNNNRVWVKWFDGVRNGIDSVRGLAEGALIVHLRKAFANQQDYPSPGTLSIYESDAATEPLRLDKPVKNYFACSPPNGPGTGCDTPLVVTFQLAPVRVPAPVPAASMEIAEVYARLDEFMKSWDGKAPQLEPFSIQEDAVLYPYLRSDITEFIPASPDRPDCPSLILHALRKDSHKKRKAYNYIMTHEKNAPIGLFATSGAGKTRTIFEYLSHNFGYYFVADRKNNPGSLDFTLFLQECKDKVKNCNGDQKQSEANLLVVEELVSNMVCARHAVFNYIDKALKSTRKGQEGLSPYEWLLLQVYPEDFLGRDIFRDLLLAFFRKGGCKEIATGVPVLQSCFVDEAQMLSTMMKDAFLSSKCDEKRSVHSALVKGLCRLAVTGFIRYPCFSGTGLSIEMCAAETKSVTAKPKTHEDFCADLTPMSTADVIEYMESFLCLDSVGKDLVSHVAEWLRGRPRWTATFLERFFVRTNKLGQLAPRGKFSDAELPIVKALDRYIEVLTLPKHIVEKRHSWSLAAGTSAYAAISRIFLLDDSKVSGIKAYELQRVVHRATFEFALSGRPSLLQNAATELVENGVAAVRRIAESADGTTTHIEAVIDEPLIIQAGVNFFGLERTATERFASARSHSEKGTAFEQFILPSIQKNFCEVLKSQLIDGALNTLVGFGIPKWSCYGVVVLDAIDDVAQTLAWIQQSMHARFEGTVAPFCYPDTKIGPDVLFFLRTLKYDDFRLVVSQAKFKNSADQLQALRTITPELFYYQNRTSGAKLNTQLSAEEKDAWMAVKKMLFMEEELSTQNDTESRSSSKRRNKSQSTKPRTKRTRRMLRFVVQYANTTASATPGLLAFGQTHKKCPANCKCAEHDILVSIDKKNADTLLGPNGAKIMELVKNQGK